MFSGGDRMAIDTAIEHLRDALNGVAADSPVAKSINEAWKLLSATLERHQVSGGQDEDYR